MVNLRQNETQGTRLEFSLQIYWVFLLLPLDLVFGRTRRHNQIFSDP